MSRHMTERTTVRLPDDLIMRAKHKAATEGRSLTALIEDGLRRVLNERGPVAATGRILPPVSTATLAGPDCRQRCAVRRVAPGDERGRADYDQSSNFQAAEPSQ